MTDTLKIYAGALESVKRNTCSKEDRLAVKVFLQDATRHDGRRAYLHNLISGRYHLNNNAKAVQVIDNLREIARSVQAFVDGTPIPEELYEPATQYMQYWYDLTDSEGRMYDAMRAARQKITPEMRERLRQCD